MSVSAKLSLRAAHGCRQTHASWIDAGTIISCAGVIPHRPFVLSLKLVRLDSRVHAERDRQPILSQSAQTSDTDFTEPNALLCSVASVAGLSDLSDSCLA